MGRLDGKVALITGAARGQGRSHAVRLAGEGADIVALDVEQDIKTVAYHGADSSDLAETQRLVEETGRGILCRHADVRYQDRLDEVVAEALARFGHIDIVCPNAGITSYAPTWELTDAQWQDVIDINLTGAWRTAKAAIPSMIKANRGGSITFISSGAGVKGFANCAHYVASKHGVLGLMRSLGIELAKYSIRVNALLPSTVRTDMVTNERTYRRLRPDLDNPALEDVLPTFSTVHLMPVPMLDPGDVSDALLWLSSDEARYITGVALPVDAGSLLK